MNPGPPGCYGKLPARGDFIARHIAPDLITPWDHWLACLTRAAQAAAGSGVGAQWPGAWLTAPIWHFALAPPLVPGPGAAGVLIASADRVGRFFPFTIIASASGLPSPSWFAAAEALILTALDDDFEPDGFAQSLQTLGRPEPSFAFTGLSHWRSAGSDKVPPASYDLEHWPNEAESAALILGP